MTRNGMGWDATNGTQITDMGIHLEIELSLINADESDHSPLASMDPAHDSSGTASQLETSRTPETAILRR